MRKTSGFSLLLLIFLSLCLIIFSLLSLSESTADLNLNQKSADRTIEYYAAVTQANKVLAQIDRQLLAFLSESVNAEHPGDTYLSLCKELVSSDPEIPYSISSPDESTPMDSGASAPCVTLSFSVPVTDTQELQVILTISYPEKADDVSYEISSWKIVNTRAWTPDTSMNLLRMTEP